MELKDVLTTDVGQVKDLKEFLDTARKHAAELAKLSAEEISEEQLSQVEALTEKIAAVKSRVESLSRAGDALKGLGEAAEPEPEPEPEVDVVPEVKAEVVASEHVEVEPAKELVTAGQFSGSALVQRVNSTPPPPMAPGQVTGINRPLSNVFSYDSSGRDGSKFGTVADLAALTADKLLRYSNIAPAYLSEDPIAVYRRANEANIAEFTVKGDDVEHDMAVWDRVIAKQPTYNNGRIEFATGWCAPAESLYELCPELSTLDGIVDLPELVAQRGRITTVNGPDFSAIYDTVGIGQILTEAQVIAGTTKQCVEIPCPPNSTTTLDVNPLCLTGNLLTLAGYPEFVERYIREAIKANAHKNNATILARMVAAATAVTLPGATGPTDTSTASWFFDAVTRYAAWLRQKYRTSINQVVEAVAPAWVRQQVGADFARRTGRDEFVGMELFDQALADARIRVQWVYDWQSLNANPALIAAMPATYQILVFLPGTFTRLRANVIRLGTVYSPAQLALNQYTALFAEEGIGLLERCFDSLVITVPNCASGTTGAASGSCDVTP